jgi:hypothetical protein
LPEETLVVVCPNPSCRREIEEPIKLKVLSVARPIEYEACPFCFTRLDHEPPVEQEELPEPTVEQQEEFMDETEDADLVTEEETDSRSALLKKVKSLIPKSNGPRKEKEETEPETEPSIQELPEEPQTEPAAKEEPKAEQTAATETEFSGCKNSFGYLANRSPDTPIPQECMLCPRIVDCMLKIKAD